MAALWGILWTLSAIQEWLFGLVGLIEWFYWAVYHVVLFVAMVQRQTQSVIAALLLMPCCIPSQSAGPSSLGAVWELWLFDRGKARLALRVPTLQVTIDWVITGSNSELVLWENPSWYHFYWAIWMNYVDWNPICLLDWIGFYDNLENNLVQNWSSKYSRILSRTYFFFIILISTSKSLFMNVLPLFSETKVCMYERCMHGWNYLYWPPRDASVYLEGRPSGLLVLFVCSS